MRSRQPPDREEEHDSRQAKEFHDCSPMTVMAAVYGLSGEFERSSDKKRRPGRPPFLSHHAPAYWIAAALSNTSWVQAPCGTLVMTGADLPDITILTVRS